jgi:hypothetical protein
LKKPDCIEQLFTGAHETRHWIFIGDVRTCFRYLATPGAQLLDNLAEAKS